MSTTGGRAPRTRYVRSIHSDTSSGREVQPHDELSSHAVLRRSLDGDLLTQELGSAPDSPSIDGGPNRDGNPTESRTGTPTDVEQISAASHTDFSPVGGYSIPESEVGSDGNHPVARYERDKLIPIFDSVDDEDHHSNLGSSKSYYLLIHRERPKEMIMSIGEVLLECLDSSEILENRVSSSNTDSNQSFHRMQTWLNDCLNTHTECNHIATTRQDSLPTRLVDLTKLKTESIVKVIETNSLLKETKYVTLSHCWGGILGLNLTTTTYADMTAAILASTLPLTFRDAATVATYLDCNYIWIDSLCIIQDSHEDWLRESATMATVYSNALVNIAASASKNSNEGLFRYRNALPLAQCKIKASCACTHTRWISCSGTPSSNESGVLHRRGWVTQELLLAPRVITFGQEQIGWQCYTMSASEKETDSFYRNEPKNCLAGLTDWNDESFSWDLTGCWRTRGEGFSRSHLSSWGTIIQNTYCNSDLTFESDKLVAIAGIARKMHESSQGRLGRYLAGLWEHNLLFQLDWTADDEGRRPAEYRAPTWSWASKEGRIRMGGGPVQPDWRFLFAIREVETTPVMDPFGAVTAGYLRLSARLCCVSLRDKDPSDPNHRDWCPWGYIEVQGIPYQAHGLSASPDDYAYWLKCQSDGSTFYVMPMFEEKNRGHDWGFNALMLQPTGKKKGQFYRVGLINPYDDKLTHTLREAVAVQTLSDELHQGQEGNGRYILELV